MSSSEDLALAPRTTLRPDLLVGGRRPWPVRAALQVMGWFVGMIPGPPIVFSYCPDLLHPDLRAYMMRGVAASTPGRPRSWTKGEAELMGAFVSDLNTCHF